MKVFSVIGDDKTNTMKAIGEKLSKRHFSVGRIQNGGSCIETTIDALNGRENLRVFAGSTLQNITGEGVESYIAWSEKKSLNELLRFCDSDFVMLENSTQEELPKLLIAESIPHAVEKISEFTHMKKTFFAILLISGEKNKEYEGIPVFCIGEGEALIDLIENVIFEKLPGFPEKCCSVCGKSCGQLCMDILSGKSKRSDCSLSTDKVQLCIDGRGIEMVGFVSRILKNTVKGIVSELDGYRKNGNIEVKIGYENDIDAVNFEK